MTKRARQERVIAAQATHAQVAALHRELASRYQQLAAEESSMTNYHRPLTRPP